MHTLWPKGINKSLQEEVGKRKPVCERVGSQCRGRGRKPLVKYGLCGQFGYRGGSGPDGRELYVPSLLPEDEGKLLKAD